MARRRKDLKMLHDPTPREYEVKSPAKVKSIIKATVGAAAAIRELQEEVESSQATNYDTMEHYISLYKQEVDLGIPEGKRFVGFDARSGKAPDIIHRAMGILMSPLRPLYIPPKVDPDANDEQMIIQNYLTGCYEYLKRKHKQPFDLQSLFWQLLVGKSYIQQSYLPYYWDKRATSRLPSEEFGEDDDEPTKYKKDVKFNARVENYRAHQGPPFFVESPDPRTIWPIIRPSGIDGYVKKYSVQRFDAEDAFAQAGQPIRLIKDDAKSANWQVIVKKPGNELPPQSEGNNDTVEYFEYLDEQFIYYVVADEVVHAYNHKGSIRIEPAWGLITGFREFELMAVSVLYAVRHELPQFDFLRTLWVNRAYIDVFPQLFAELAAGEDPLRDGEQNLESWEIEPMSIKQVRGRITNAFKDAQAGVDYRSLVDEMSVDIDMATLPGIARGVAGAQQPGYAISQLSQTMKTVWRPIITSREDQWGGIYEHNLWTIKNVIQTEVTVFAETRVHGVRSGEYLSIEPKDIPDFYQVRAALDPELPIDTQGNMLTWSKMGAEGWATDEEVSMHGFNKPDWHARRRQIDRDMARRQMRPAAIEDAIVLGKIRLQNQVSSEMGLDKLNAPFQQSLDSFRGTGGMPGQEQAPGTERTATAAGPNGVGLGQGGGIEPTKGAATPAGGSGPRR